ncbi:MAG: type IV secretion system DNA-binding domain-containing protein [Caulobacter sp.]|nr:type IV secretion system DNA-binding domain-containing protein [Caulobacter sp.]
MLASVGKWLTSSPPQRAVTGFHSHADTPLIRLHGHDCLRVRDLFEGVQIVGGTGSGKSSGSGKAIAMAMLQAGWGGLVLCAKPDEADRWVGYLRASGRAAHLIRVHPGSPYRINFPDYELHRPDGGGRETFNLVALMEVMMDATATAQGSAAGGESAAFWILSRRELLANAIEPLVAATGRFRLDELMQMVASAPTSREEAFSDDWKARSFCYRILRASFEAPVGGKLAMHELQAAADYWFSTFAGLDPKTRSNIVATLTSAISPFLRGVLHDSFCTQTTVIPELTHQGAVIVWDFPVKVWGAAAVVATQMIKYQWQKATERRAIDSCTRPVFLFADECQFFLSDYDAEFQSTARSAMAATIYITQNLPTYYSRLRARDAKATADSLLGNFQTKIFHANTDPTTNQYAADLIGRSLQARRSKNWSASENSQSSYTDSENWGTQSGSSTGRNRGTNFGVSISTTDEGRNSVSFSGGSNSGSQSGGSRSRSKGGGYSVGESQSYGSSDGGGWSEQMDYTIQPVVFASALRKGGQADGGLVDGIVVQGGRRFQTTGAHWLPCTFRQ